MSDNRCAFSSPLIAEQYVCHFGQQVVRRGGAEVACCDATACSRCESVFERLKQVTLPVFGVDDDLTSMPHSVIQKIQFGGLSGLQHQSGIEPAEHVDIDHLLNQVAEQYGGIDSLPYSGLVDTITAYQLKRRQHRR
ncbi:hypothetical protein [Thiohalophilus sp.]|uniref:hypothetical protein n=1 Tax=Thiohalophilus sp. TaxID=3028392 RepID=UPI0039764ADC